VWRGQSDAAAAASVRSLADISTDDRRHVPVPQHAARPAALSRHRTSSSVSAADRPLPAVRPVLGRRRDARPQGLRRHQAVCRSDTTQPRRERPAPDVRGVRADLRVDGAQRPDHRRTQGYIHTRPISFICLLDTNSLLLC